jgi:hypothetical protein
MRKNSIKIKAKRSKCRVGAVKEATTIRERSAEVVGRWRRVR